MTVLPSFNEIAALIAGADQTVQFRKHTNSVEGSMGQRMTTAANLGQPLSCWLQPASARVVESYAARDLAVTHRAYTTFDPGIGEGTWAVIDAVTYAVRGVTNDGGLSKLYTVDLELNGG